MTSLELQTALVTVVWPAAATGLGLAAALAMPWSIAARVTSALALATGLAVADVGVRGWQGLWPMDITRRVPHVALLAVVVGAAVLVATRHSRRMALVAMPLGSGFLAGTIGLGFANSPLTDDFSSLGRFVWWGVVSAILFVVQLGIEGIAARRAGPGLPLLLAVCAATSAGVIAAAGSLSLGQVCGGFAVCLCVLVAFAFWRPAIAVHVGTAQLSAAVLGAIVAAAHFFAEMPLSAAYLLLAMPASGWIADFGPLKRRPLLATFATCAAVGVMAAVATAIVWANRSSEASPYG
jgi:hypothetical protein